VATEIYMPQLGLTMTEGIVVRWLKSEGDPVTRGEVVLEIETDKVTTEIEAPADGVLGPILAEEGSVVPVGGLLSHVLKSGEVSPGGSRAAATPPTSPQSQRAPQDGTEERPAGRLSEARIMASPRARRLAHELGADLTQVEASGPGGRIVEADVRWHVDQMQTVPLRRASPVARRLAEGLGVDLSGVQGSGPGGRVVKEDVQRVAASVSTAPPGAKTDAIREPGPVVPLTGIRRVVAERMAHSFTTAPHFYLSVEAEATALSRMREGLMARIETSTGVRLTITDILVKVCAQALIEFPDVNVAWSESGGAERGGVVRQSQVNIGVAIALDEGLVVPVIRHADQLSLGEIARQRVDLLHRARTGKLTFQDLEGGTFTLSNLGMYGIDQFQAIINPPQSAILAVGRIRERVVARDGAAVVRPTMHLTLSVDHRLLDGAHSALFLECVARFIEEPYLLLE
jgi:pyruvate dehydrogenase E2 component (dihydrolipoamide acetyltransferase)